MKTIKNLLLLVIVTTFVFSCKNNQEPEIKTVEIETTKNTSEKTLDPNATYAKVEFGIDGMTCAMGCAKSIEKKMAKMEGVKSAKVDFEKELAMVEYDEAKVTPESLEEAVSLAGDTYSVRDMKTVESFTSEKNKKGCKGDCDDKKDCCKDKKKGKNKKDVKSEEQGKVMACADNCKKENCCEAKA